MAKTDSSRGRMGMRWVGIALALSFLWYALSQVSLGDQLLLTAARGDGEPVTWSAPLSLEAGNWRKSDLQGSVEFSGDLGPPEELRALLPGLQSGAKLAIHLDLEGKGTINNTALVRVEVRPGLGSILKSADKGTLPIALVALIFATLLINTRWWFLLRAAGCATGWLSTLRITYTGLFFNVILPGLSGGDLARGYIAARGHPERRAAAVVTVVADRVFGLWAMTLVAVAAVSTSGPRFESLRLPVAAAAAGLTLGWLVYTLEGPRRWLRLEERISRLPTGSFIVDLDRVGRDLAQRPMVVVTALCISMANHLTSAGAIFWLAQGLGESLTFHQVLVISTVANTLSAIPLAPGGLGVGEILFGGLFRMAGGSWALGVGTSLAWRLVLLAVGLIGGLSSLLPGGRKLRQEFRAVAEGKQPGGDSLPAGDTRRPNPPQTRTE